MKMSETRLNGKIIGFEEHKEYTMESVFGETSPFRLLSCMSAPLTFVVVNPYHVLENYSLELDENILKTLEVDENTIENVAVLCIVRLDNHTLYVNLRSPVIINVKNGFFTQIILPDESYGVSVPFVAKKDK
jgi:flagellar assembly factor FliW